MEGYALNVKVLGLKETRDAFRRLGEKTSGKTLLAALVTGALEIANRAKMEAPFITGSLRRSIHVGAHTSDPRADWPFASASDLTAHGAEYSDIKGEEVTADMAKVEVGTNLEYAARVEFGFAGADSLGRVYNQPADPYLRAGFDLEKDAVEKTISEALDILIKKEFG